jgi:hypothetical protein
MDKNKVRYFMDLEFHEDGRTIELISIAIVSESGRCIYLENSEFDWTTVPSGHWLWVNVRPYLREEARIMATRAEIAKRIIDFMMSPTRNIEPEIWGYFSSYDWVCMCQLFGRMLDLPEGMPKFIMDLKQELVMRGLSKEWKEKTVPEPVNEHNALADAEWNRQLWIAINKSQDPRVPGCVTKQDIDFSRENSRVAHDGTRYYEPFQSLHPTTKERPPADDEQPS